VGTNNAFSRTTVSGTFLYLAPEYVKMQKRAGGGIKVVEGTIDASADIYSFGYILYELWNEERIYADQQQMEVMQAKMRDARAISQSKMFSKLSGSADKTPLPIDPNCPWAPLIKKCWALKPDARPTALQLLQDFARLVQQSGNT
jgi:serine/threonine protein kinase